VLQHTMYDSGRFIQVVLRVLQDRKDTMSALAFVLQPGPDLTSHAPALYLHLACVRESPAACARPGRGMRPPAESGVAVWVRSQYGRRLSARRLLSRSLPFSMCTIRIQSEHFQSTVKVCDLQQFGAIAIQTNQYFKPVLAREREARFEFENLHDNRKRERDRSHYSLCSAMLCYALLYSTLFNSTLLYSTLLCSTLLYSTLL
jgi:hypothetical protein